MSLRSDHKRIKEIVLLILTGISFLMTTACHNQTREAEDTKMPNQDSSAMRNTNIQIIIYGSKSCPHCVAFIDKMDQENISYIFKEVDNNNKNYLEMLDKVNSINFTGYISYPIVDVGGQIFVAPEFDRFIEIYRRN